MAAPAGIPVISALLDQVDAELARWRDRLAAASRNVSELSELPEYGAARIAASGTGRLATAARGLVATMDELWQGVLLIGAALDRAEQARRAGSRLWRGEEAAQQALAILQGPSITVDLSETPVLHRRLLAGPRASVTVSPDTLLQTMDAAFDRARESLGHITEAGTRAAGLRVRLAGAVARLPVQGRFGARLEAAALPDPLDQLDALDALAPQVDAALAAADRARAGLAVARLSLAGLQSAAAEALAVGAASQSVAAAALPGIDAAALPELAVWLDRIARTLELGHVEPCLVGLANWQGLFDRVQGESQALAEAARSTIARRDDLTAWLGALRAKHRARLKAPGGADPVLDALAAAARDSLAHSPTDLDSATRDLAAYGAALARH